MRARVRQRLVQSGPFSTESGRIVEIKTDRRTGLVHAELGPDPVEKERPERTRRRV